MESIKGRLNPIGIERQHGEDGKRKTAQSERGASLQSWHALSSHASLSQRAIQY
jgi:hypothetical protein